MVDADIQARYPGAKAVTNGTMRVWRVGGTYVGQTVDGKGMTARCPVS